MKFSLPVATFGLGVAAIAIPAGPGSDFKAVSSYNTTSKPQPTTRSSAAYPSPTTNPLDYGPEVKYTKPWPTNVKKNTLVSVVIAAPMHTPRFWHPHTEHSKPARKCPLQIPHTCEAWSKIIHSSDEILARMNCFPPKNCINLPISMHHGNAKGTREVARPTSGAA